MTSRRSWAIAALAALALVGCAKSEPATTGGDGGTSGDGGAQPSCTAGAPGSIAGQCADQNRVCIVAGGNAQCGDCLTGFLLAGSTCRAVVTCADCTQNGENCTTPAGDHTDAVCGLCVPGDVADGTTCRAAYTCSTLPTPCTSDQTCVPSSTNDAGVTTDATCVTNGTCNCNGTGEDGVVLPDSNVGQGCICETKPGYFFSTGNSIGALPCDADNDGWVRTDAYSELTSTDSVIRSQAKCTLRTVKQFTLINDLGETLTLPVPSTAVPVAGTDGGLPLFEPGILDDQTHIDQDPKDFPAYGGDGGRILQANELNPLTKACVSALADFNDNGAPDVAEWAKPSLSSAGGTFGDEASWNGFNTAVNIPSALQADFQIYTQFSYFLELDQGWWSSANGGTYVIHEKSRLPSGPDKFALTYGRSPPDGGQFMTDYWKECPRAVDTWYGTTNVLNPVGMDFASVSAPAPGWHGMNAESQFKCVNILSQQAYAQLSANGEVQNPQDVTVSGTLLQRIRDDGSNNMETLDWQVDACTAQSGQYSNAGSPSPADPALSCVPLAYPPSGGVAWAAVRLGSQDQYERGCVVRCPGQAFFCPGTDPSAPDGGSCFFLCGDIAASDQLNLDGGGWSLLGEVPMRALSPAVIPADGGNSGGWTLIAR